jgi:hypothetical protein
MGVTFSQAILCACSRWVGCTDDSFSVLFLFLVPFFFASVFGSLFFEKLGFP